MPPYFLCAINVLRALYPVAEGYHPIPRSRANLLEALIAVLLLRSASNTPREIARLIAFALAIGRRQIDQQGRDQLTLTAQTRVRFP